MPVSWLEPASADTLHPPDQAPRSRIGLNLAIISTNDCMAGSASPDRNCLQVPVLAHEIEAAFGRPALNQMLRDAIPDLQHEPSPLHVKLLDLPWSDVFTTNYDTLLERACRSVISQRYDVIVNPEDLGHSGA